MSTKDVELLNKGRQNDLQKDVEIPTKDVELYEKPSKDDEMSSLSKRKNSISKKFRINTQKIFFTYKTHLDIDHFSNWLNKLHPISEWIICHEQADNSDPYPHTHAAICFQNKINIKNARHFDYDEDPENRSKKIHPNFSSIRNWIKSVAYCIKEKPPVYKANFDVVKFLTDNKKNAKRNNVNIADLCEQIAKSKNAFEAVKNCASSLRDAMAVIAIYNTKNHVIDPDLVKYFENWKLRSWQEDLFNLLSEKPDNRAIHWIYDEIGGKGKSQFCTYCEIRMPEKCLVIAASGSLRDIADVIRNWMDNGNTPKSIIIDLPRTFQDRDSVYTIIESIKNGRLTCTKYKGATLKFCPPHVIIMANWMPIRHKLSKDRWHVYELIEDDIPNNHKLVEITNRKPKEPISKVCGRNIIASGAPTNNPTEISEDITEESDYNVQDDENIDISDINLLDSNIEPI